MTRGGTWAGSSGCCHAPRCVAATFSPALASRNQRAQAPSGREPLEPPPHRARPPRRGHACRRPGRRAHRRSVRCTVVRSRAPAGAGADAGADLHRQARRELPARGVPPDARPDRAHHARHDQLRHHRGRRHLRPRLRVVAGLQLGGWSSNLDGTYLHTLKDLPGAHHLLVDGRRLYVALDTTGQIEIVDNSDQHYVRGLLDAPIVAPGQIAKANGYLWTTSGACGGGQQWVRVDPATGATTSGAALSAPVLHAPLERPRKRHDAPGLRLGSEPDHGRPLQHRHGQPRGRHELDRVRVVAFQLAPMLTGAASSWPPSTRPRSRCTAPTTWPCPAPCSAPTPAPRGDRHHRERGGFASGSAWRPSHRLRRPHLQADRPLDPDRRRLLDRTAPRHLPRRHRLLARRLEGLRGPHPGPRRRQRHRQHRARHAAAHHHEAHPADQWPRPVPCQTVQARALFGTRPRLAR